MNDSIPRVLIWCAVSSKPQASEDKSSLTVQEQAGRAYAEKVGGQIVAVLTVGGHSRDLWRWSDAEDAMPAYGALRRHCEAADFDVLFVWDADRLGRDPALSAQALSLVKRAGASVHVHSGGYTVGEQSESASYIYAIDTVRSGQEQKRRIKRHYFGMVNRVKRGLHPGRWPYGYKPIRDARGECVGAEPVPGEVEVIRLVTQMYLDGIGYESIANALNERGYPAPEGGDWWHAPVRRMMTTDIYAGYVEWGGARNEHPSDKFTALWDAATFKAIRRERHRRSSISGGSEIATYLSGIVICGECGRSMAHHPVEKHGGDGYYRYYSCKNRSHVANNVPVADLLAAFDAWLKTLRSVGVEAALRTALPEEAEQLELERDNVQVAILDAQDALDRLAAAVASGTIQATTASRTEARLYDQIDAHNTRLVEIDEQLATLPDPTEQRNHLEAILSVGASPSEADKFRLNSLLRTLGVRIICERGDIKRIVY